MQPGSRTSHCLGYLPVKYATGIPRGSFRCPTEDGPGNADPGSDFALAIQTTARNLKYDPVHSLFRLGSTTVSSRTIFIADSKRNNGIALSMTNLDNEPSRRHNGTTNAGFCDGHVQNMTRQELPWSLTGNNAAGNRNKYPWCGY